MTKLKVTLASSAVFLSANALGADNCTGTYHSVIQTASTQEIGKGVTLTSYASLSSIVWKESGEVRTGACSGYMFGMPDGKVRVAYACARKNQAGDVVVDEGSLEPGASRGTWKVTFATGAHAQLVGDSGWWQPVMDDGKVFVGNWGGSCK